MVLELEWPLKQEGLFFQEEEKRAGKYFQLSLWSSSKIPSVQNYLIVS